MTDCRQKVPHGFVLVPSPLLLRVSLSRLLRGRVTGGVLRLSNVNYEVLVQLLSVDVMKFTLAEIRKEINKGKDVECEARNVVNCIYCVKSMRLQEQKNAPVPNGSQRFDQLPWVQDVLGLVFRTESDLLYQATDCARGYLMHLPLGTDIFFWRPLFVSNRNQLAWNRTKEHESQH